MTDNEALNEAVRILQRIESEWIGPTGYSWPLSLSFALHTLVIIGAWHFGAWLWKLLIYIKNHKEPWLVLFAIALPSPALAQDITTGKIHQWDLFEDVDDDGGSAAAALTQVGSLSVVGERVSGFSASNYLTLPSVSSFASDASYTVSMWVSASSYAGTNAAGFSIGGATAGVSRVIYPFQSATSSTAVWNGSNTSFVTLSGYPPADGADHHLVMVVESASSAKLYVDGVERGTTSSSVVMPASVTGGRIGNYHLATSQPFGGAIGQVKVFNRALDAAEVAEVKAQDEFDIAAFRDPPGGTDCLNCGTIQILSIEYKNNSGVWINVTNGTTLYDHNSGVAVGGAGSFPTDAITTCATVNVSISSGLGPFDPDARIVLKRNGGASQTMVVSDFAVVSSVKRYYIGGPGNVDDDDGDCEENKDDCDDDADGVQDVDEDDDGDTIPNDEDDDDDDDGCRDNEECEDDDEDGLANCEDPDDDNDGQADHIDCDWHGEGGGCVPDDPVDEDFDDDGVNDDVDQDDDNDGIPDWVDTDDDNDGIPDETDPDHDPDDDDDGPDDTDGDGIPDWDDPDDDNDGIPDETDPDDDNDGLPDEDDTPPPPGPAPCGGGSLWCCPVGSFCDGLVACSEVPGCCEGDADCDGIPDEDDPDDDDDGIPDEDDPPDDPEDPGACECCDEILVALELINESLNPSPSEWDPAAPQVEGGQGINFDFTGVEHDGEGQSRGEIGERHINKTDEAARMLATGEWSSESAEALPYGTETSGLPSRALLDAWPIPAVNATPCDFIWCLPFEGIGASPGDMVCLHSMPLENNALFPHLSDLWGTLETVRVMMRWILVALATLKAWSIFGRLFRDLLGA